MNQTYACVNQPYATLTLASALREMFGVQLYKNNARALLSRILNLDWLQHARSVRGVYEFLITHGKGHNLPFCLEDINENVPGYGNYVGNYNYTKLLHTSKWLDRFK